MDTIGEAISRVRGIIKAVKLDAFLTDRYIYSVIMKHGKVLMRRQDQLNRIMRFNSIFQSLDYVELIEVNAAQGLCGCINTGCKIKRTKDRIPAMMEGYWGPLLRGVTSLDGSVSVDPTFPATFEKIAKQKTFKYNKTKYYWFLDGYLYFPNMDWDAVRIEGVFEGNVRKYNCDKEDDCQLAQEQFIAIPGYLFTEIEQFIQRELLGVMQVPVDTAHDNKNIIR